MGHRDDHEPENSADRRTVDQVAGDLPDTGIEITVRVLDGEEFEYVLVEGDERSLLALADLIRAQAVDPPTCGYQLHPRGAGSAFFSRDATHGVYIHRLPCEHDEQVELSESP